VESGVSLVSFYDVQFESTKIRDNIPESCFQSYLGRAIGVVTRFSPSHPCAASCRLPSSSKPTPCAVTSSPQISKHVFTPFTPFTRHNSTRASWDSWDIKNSALTSPMSAIKCLHGNIVYRYSIGFIADPQFDAIIGKRHLYFIDRSRTMERA